MDANGISPKETVSASKKLSSDDAKRLAKAASRVVVAKGKKVETFRPKSAVTSDLVSAMLGPTGNLRAPTIVSGKTVIVGFHPDVYEEHLGS